MAFAIDSYISLLPSTDKPTSMVVNGNNLLFSAFLSGSLPTPAKLWKYDVVNEAFVDAEPIYRTSDWGVASFGDRTLVITSATNPISGNPYETASCVVYQTSTLNFVTDVSVTPVSPLYPQYVGDQWAIYPSYASDGFGKVFGLLDSPYASSPGGKVDAPYFVSFPGPYSFSSSAGLLGSWYYDDPWDVVFVDYSVAPSPGVVGWFAAKTAIGNYCLPASVLNPTGQGLIPNGFLDGGLFGIEVIPDFGGNHIAWITGWLRSTGSPSTTYNYIARVTLQPYTFGAFGSVVVNSIRINAGSPIYSTPRYAAGNIYVMAQMPQWFLQPLPAASNAFRLNATTLLPNNPTWAGAAYGGIYKLTDVSRVIGNTYILTVADTTTFGLTSTTGLYIVDGNTDQITDGGTIDTFAGGAVVYDADFNLYVNSTGWALFEERIAKLTATGRGGWRLGILSF
jgi:hypothetical protein